MPDSPPSDPPQRVLLGPGPSTVHPRVLRAMSATLVGHLDPAFLAVMDETVRLLQGVFQTANRLTIPISGTGSAGMEAAVCNIIEPGDTMVVGIHGFFGARIAGVASRYGANVVAVQADWGRALDPAQIQAAIKAQRQVKAVAVVHAETSTGVLQPLQDIARLAHEAGALFLVDAVTSLGGVELPLDEWGIDVSYSCSQKCLGAPSGLAPISFGPRADQVIHGRKSKVTSWYLDMTLLEKYWGPERVYHHTAPISMMYAMREALRLAAEEGLAPRFARHARNARALWAGLEAMGLRLVVEPALRAVPLTTVYIPEGVDDAKVRGALLSEHGIEIGGGLGGLRGKAWRIGLMGHSSSEANVLAVLLALERALARQGFRTGAGAGVAAAAGAM